MILEKDDDLCSVSSSDISSASFSPSTAPAESHFRNLKAKSRLDFAPQLVTDCRNMQTYSEPGMPKPSVSRTYMQPLLASKSLTRHPLLPRKQGIETSLSVNVSSLGSSSRRPTVRRTSPLIDGLPLPEAWDALVNDMVDTTPNSRETAEDYESSPDVGGGLAMDLAKGCSEFAGVDRRMGLGCLSSPTLSSGARERTLYSKVMPDLTRSLIETDDADFSSSSRNSDLNWSSSPMTNVSSGQNFHCEQ